eukprot:CCRYP_015171-RB/>CCRYP_015171-RB protein AED:0.01 eAED:0.01 QI:558/1/1/1/1/1/3/180/1682
MAQANFLPPLPPGMEHQHIPLLKEALTNNSHLVMALPTFTRDASPPTVAHLLGTYPTPVSRGVGSSCEGSHPNGSNVDVSNLLTNHDFQYQLWQKQQQKDGQNSGADASWGESWGVAATPATKMSVDDAFGDLPEVEDLPLPSLQYVVSEENMETCEGITVDEGNGHMVGSAVDEFGDFDGASVEPVIIDQGEGPQLGTKNPVADGVNNEETVCGDFDAAGFPFPSSDVMDVAIENTLVGPVAGIDASAEISDNEFSDFDAARDSALPYSAGDQPSPEFENVNSPYLPNPGQYGPTLSISDAFEPLVVEHEGPPASVNEVDQCGGVESTGTPMDEVDEQLDFGRFESTAPQPYMNENNVVTDEGDEFGGFESTFTGVEGTAIEHSEDNFEFDTESGSSPPKPEAFPIPGDLSQAGSFSGTPLYEPGNHDVTLSITGAFESLVSEQKNDTTAWFQDEANVIENQGDEFGGFESNEIGSPDNSGSNDEIVTALPNTVPNTQEECIASTWTADNARGPTAQLGNHVSTLSISDAFASLIGDQESSAAPDDRVSFVENSVHTTEENREIPPDSAHSEVSVDSAKVSIFDEKKTSDDDSIKAEPEEIFINNSELEVQIQGNSETGIPSVGVSAFDDVFGGIQDAPLPPLEAFSPTLEESGKSNAIEMSECDESFGDFEGNAAVTGFIPEEEFVEKSELADAGFGNVDSVPRSLVQDVAHQIQPLETFPQEAEERHQSQRADALEFDDSFCDFEGTSAIVDGHEKHADVSEPFSEHSGNFDNFDHQNANEASKDEHYSISANQGLPPVLMDAATNEILDYGKHNDLSGFPTYDNVAFSQANDTPEQQTFTIDDQTNKNNDITGCLPFDRTFATGDGTHAEDMTTRTKYEAASFGGTAYPIHDIQACTGTQFVAATDVSEAKDDDFGDFSAFGAAGIVQVEVRTDHNEQNDSTILHEKPEASAYFQGINMVHTEADDDDFGDFAAFGSPDEAHAEERTDGTEGGHIIVSNYQSEAVGDCHGIDIDHNGVDADDYGGFSAFGSVDLAKDRTDDTQSNPATTFNWPSETSTDLCADKDDHTAADEDRFGDFSAFGSADILHTEDRVHTQEDDVHTQEDHSIVSNKLSDDVADTHVDTSIHAETHDDCGEGDVSRLGSAGMLRTKNKVPTQEDHSTILNETAATLDVNDFISTDGDHDDFGDFSDFGSADMLHTEDKGHSLQDHSSISNKQSEVVADREVNTDIGTEGDHEEFGDFSAFGSANMLYTEHRNHNLAVHSTVLDKQPDSAKDLLVDNIVHADADDVDFGGCVASIDRTQDDHATTSNKMLEAIADLHDSNFAHSGVDDQDVSGFAAFGSTDVELTEDLGDHTPQDHSSVSSSKLVSAEDHQINNVNGTAGDDDEFGNFTAFEAADNSAMVNPSDAISFDAEFGEFAQFDSAPLNDANIHVSFNDYADLSEKIRSLTHFPSPLPPKEDVVQCFEKCLKNRETPRIQLARCVEVCEILSDTNSDVSQQWENTMSCVKTDLERGRKILEFFSDRLTPADRSILLRSEKLRNHVLGLAEFVRISRSITASVQDIFCLEINGGFHESSSDWNKGKFIMNTSFIEEAWGDVCSKALDMGILSETPQLESIDEIRSRYLCIENGELGELCQLTLQPLYNDGKNQGTRSTVKWKGKKYMSCAANFLANRLSQ